MGHRIQRLRRRVTHRVNSTIRGIRAKSIQYAGFPTRPDANGIDVNTGAAASAADDSKLKHMQLHNTIVRQVSAHRLFHLPYPATMLAVHLDCVGCFNGQS